MLFQSSSKILTEVGVLEYEKFCWNRSRSTPPNLLQSWSNQGCGIELELEIELAFKNRQQIGIELELAFEKTHKLGIVLELAFATNSPTLTKFPLMSGILIELQRVVAILII